MRRSPSKPARRAAQRLIVGSAMQQQLAQPLQLFGIVQPRNCLEGRIND